MGDDAVVFDTVQSLARKIRAGEISARRALEVFIRRNAAVGPSLNAVVVLDLAR